jgi:hypothetical protein
VAVWAALVLGQLTRWVVMYPDTGWYLALARSLAAGEGYRVEGELCRTYPPVFPLLLSVSGPLSHTHFRPEKLAVAATGLGALVGSYWLLSQRYRGRALAVLVLLVAASPTFVYLGTVLLSDVLFFLFAAVSLAAAERFWRGPRPRRSLAVISAASLALATLTRAAGLAFYVACAVWLARPSLWRRDRRRCFVFGAALLLVACPPVVAWRVWLATQPETGTRSYSDFVHSYVLEGSSLRSGEGWRRLLAEESRTVPLQLTAAAQMLFRARSDTREPLWGVVLLPLVIVGLVRRRGTAGPSDYGFVAYALVILFWPSHQGTRLWLPVLPLILGYVADALGGLGRVAGERVRGALAGAGAAVLFGVSLTAGLGLASRSWQLRPDAVGNVALPRDRQDVARFLVEKRRGPIVVAYLRALEVIPALGDSQAAVVRLPFGPGSDAESALAALAEQGATHLVVERRIKKTGRWAERAEAPGKLVAAAPRRFRRVHQTHHVAIYRILPTLDD